jgi:hypothetical protein
MAYRATDPCVPRMIKLPAKCPQAGKRLQGSSLCVCMTDRTDRARAIGKLKLMAADARGVA